MGLSGLAISKEFLNKSFSADCFHQTFPSAKTFKMLPIILIGVIFGLLVFAGSVRAVYQLTQSYYHSPVDAEVSVVAPRNTTESG